MRCVPQVGVAGAKSAIQGVTDDQIRCLAPAQGKTSAGSDEHGVLVELYQLEYFESNFLEKASWAALSPSHAGYKAFVPQDAELKFPIEVTWDTVGTLKEQQKPPLNCEGDHPPSRDHDSINGFPWHLCLALSLGMCHKWDYKRARISRLLRHTADMERATF
ncbi:hypothetical protein O3P69_008251 [Scylla paramamosain]|uniref:Uncharacterized protein n=1 Tax=Scylla paramamosain TaxID=85552 RepID=A0AAW0T136_SCYPA